MILWPSQCNAMFAIFTLGRCLTLGTCGKLSLYITSFFEPIDHLLDTEVTVDDKLSLIIMYRLSGLTCKCKAGDTPGDFIRRSPRFSPPTGCGHTWRFFSPIAAMWHFNLVPRLQAPLLSSILKNHVIKSPNLIG